MSGILRWLYEQWECECCCCNWEFFFGSSAPVAPNPQEGLGNIYQCDSQTIHL